MDRRFRRSEERGAGLGRFGLEVPRVLRDRIGAWSAHPALRPLLDTLAAQTTLKGFLDYWAEARIADLLLQRGCRLEWEVPTPAGRTCDFHVVHGQQQFYLHVKRLANEEHSARQLGISSRLRFLERIKRPFIVRVRWEEELSEERMQEFVERAAAFIKVSHVGDELTVRAESGDELGGVRIVAPWEGPHVSLAIGLPAGFIDEVPRMRRLLKKAQLRLCRRPPRHSQLLRGRRRHLLSPQPLSPLSIHLTHSLRLGLNKSGIMPHHKVASQKTIHVEKMLLYF